MKSGVDLISEKRNRQVEIHGYSSDHDDTHASGEMAVAAMVMACPPKIRTIDFVDRYFPKDWGDYIIPTYENFEDRIEELANAGALIAAEIDRIQRWGK